MHLTQGMVLQEKDDEEKEHRGRVIRASPRITGTC